VEANTTAVKGLSSQGDRGKPKAQGYEVKEDCIPIIGTVNSFG